jgi:subfamily B ATP-binding cassette protein MsbA
VIALALVCGLLYAGGRNLRAWLTKPLMDDVFLAAPETGPEETGAGKTTDWLSRLPIPFAKGREPAGDAPGEPGRSGAAERTEAPSQAPDAGAAAPAASPAAAAATDRERAWRGLRKILLLGLGVIVVIPLAHFGREYLFQWTLGRVLVDIQQELCRKLLALPLRFHHDRSRGDTLSRVMNDVGRSHMALDLLFADVVQDVMAVAVGFAVLLSLSWQLTLASLAVAPLVMGAIAIFGRRIRKSAKRRQETLGDVTQRLVQILSGIKVIQAFRGEEYEAGSFQRENQRLFRRGMKVVKNRVLSRTVIEGLNNGIGVAVLFVGGVAVIERWWGLTPGDLTAFLTVMLTTYGPTKNITKGWTQLMESLPAAERFFELLDEPPGIEDAPDAVAIAGVQRGIRISKVSFSYGREPVLRDVSLDVAPGEVVALVGRTGAGKTTLADLLLRLHDPDSGSIEIDGVDLRRIRRDSLLDHLGVVTQEPFLFPGTIRDNIRYGRPDAPDADVERAARAAHVDEFVDALPQGWDTEVGDAGVKLSGGQRQRITIARAILKNPSILIFDEATSSLDAKSERYVQEAIDRLLGGRTVFVIAHRLSTIRHADKIVVLENGCVSAVGSHDELMAGDGLYRELVALQTGSP